jgi:hypothetical protein
MFLFFMAAATATADPSACSAAVHNDLSSAVIACSTKGLMVDPFGKGGVTDACLTALKTGEYVGQYGPKLPEVGRNGLIRDFDKKMQLCISPPKQPVTPELKTTKLWD